MANYKLIENVISTKYNDMRGLAAIDGHDRSYLNRLCTDHGVSLDDWLLLGLQFYDYEPVGRETFIVYAYLVQKQEQDESYDQIKERLSRQETVDIHKKSFSITYEELGQYVKRIDLGVLTDLSEFINSANFIDDDD